GAAGRRPGLGRGRRGADRHAGAAGRRAAAGGRTAGAAGGPGRGDTGDPGPDRDATGGDVMERFGSSLPPPAGEGGRNATGWGRQGDAARFEVKQISDAAPGPPHPVSPDGSTTLPRRGRESSGALLIEGYASLWGVADLNGD